MSDRDISALGVPPVTASDILDLLWNARDLEAVRFDEARAVPEIHAALERDDHPRAWQVIGAELPDVGTALTHGRYLTPDERRDFPDLHGLSRYAGQLCGFAGLLALREGKPAATRRLWLEGLTADPSSDSLRVGLPALAAQWPPADSSPAPADNGQTDAAHLERDRVQILEDLTRAGWHTLTVISLKDEVADVVGFATTMVIVPPQVLVASFVAGRGISQEAIALGTREALKVLLPAGPSLALAETLLTLARSVRSYHGPIGAMDLVVRAALTMKQIGHARGLGRALLDVGITFKDLELFFDALRALALADVQFRETGDTGAMAAAAYHRATICRRFEQCAVALTFLDDGRRLLPSSDVAHSWLSQFRSERLLNLMALDRRAEARACIDEWIADRVDTNASGHSSRYSIPLEARGTLDRRDGNLPGALESFAGAAAHAAREILAFRTVRFRTRERTNIGHVFDRAIRATVDAGAADLCFGIVQLARTGSLSLSVRRSTPITTDDLRVRDQEQLSAVVQRATEAVRGGTDLAAVQQEAEWLIGERDFVQADEHKSQELLDRAGIEAMALGVRARLAPSARLVEYAWTGQALIALVLDRERTTVHDLGLRREDVTRLVEAAVAEIAAAGGETALDALAEAVLEPLAARLAESTELFLVPADGLQDIPFHALPLRGEPVVASHLVQYLDRAAVLTASDDTSPPDCLNPKSSCHVLAVSDLSYGSHVPLPGVADEVSLVQSLFPVSTASASAADLLAAKSADVVHLACHALVERGQPLLSRLLCSERPVFAFEIALASFAARLVVLSACETASGPASVGGRTESLASAFLGAGAGEVAATLWPLNDEVAVLFIEQFYRHIMKTGASAARSVQVAQQSIRNTPGFQHPYYWAPFVVYGRRH